MATRHINTIAYDVDVSRLLSRRLGEHGHAVRVEKETKSALRVQTRSQEDMHAFCTALAELLLKDISHFELARMVDKLPLTLAQKQRVLPEAIKQSRSAQLDFGVARALKSHFREYGRLNLEGFVRFRMRDALAHWEGCVDRAAEEMLLEEEYLELMHLLGAFVSLQPTRIKEVSLCLNADGSYTLTDDSNVRIEYDPDCRDGIISALVGLAPERITVYDLSGGKNEDLSAALKQVFAGRVRVYR